MSAAVARLYPFLFAFVPLLNIAARNPGQFNPRDLAVLLGLVGAGCALMYAVFALLGRGRAAAGLPALATMLAVIWFFGYHRVAGLMPDEAGQPRHLVLVPLGVAATAALLWGLRRREELLAGAGRFFSLMAALLVGWSAMHIAGGMLRERQLVAKSAVLRELARPIQGSAPAGAVRRDIYLIVLDEYASHQALREQFNFDNRQFEDSLRTLGFHIPMLTRSNYVHTLLSLPSLLNAAHLAGLEREIGATRRDPSLPNHLLWYNRIVPYLERQDYRFIFFPSQWWYSTYDSPLADEEYRAWSGLDPMRAMSTTELRRAVRRGSALDYLQVTHRWDADHVRRTLDGLTRVPREEGPPVFAFAHILQPHSPYVFDRACGVLERKTDQDELAEYVGQLQCLNRMVLKTVERILRDSDTPPIILLQGDHGTKVLGATGYPRSGEVPPEAARERVGTFGAYYLPDGGAAGFGDTVTVVNVMGNVLRHYLGAELPRAADDLYISPADFPYQFRRVDARWLAGDDSAVTALGAGR